MRIWFRHYCDHCGRELPSQWFSDGGYRWAITGPGTPVIIELCASCNGKKHLELLNKEVKDVDKKVA